MITSKDIVLEKMRRFCLYQERCQSEVRTKLISLKVYGQDLEEIISDLIEEKFIDELRFSEVYARSKFNQKKWGKIKIRQHLKFKKISEYCIKKGLLEISDVDYWNSLEKILLKKIEQYGGLDFTTQNKVFKFALSKGYESEIISSVLKEIKKN